jgi:hypothetical protein
MSSSIEAQVVFSSSYAMGLISRRRQYAEGLEALSGTILASMTPHKEAALAGFKAGEECEPLAYEAFSHLARSWEAFQALNYG